MSQCFICVLWSDSGRWDWTVERELRTKSTKLPRRGKGVTGYALLRELKALVYCWDERSAAVAEELGLRVVPMETTRDEHDAQRYRRKLLSIKHALQGHRHVVLLDVDMVRTAAIPWRFWRVLQRRAPIQAPLLQHHAPKARWREGKANQQYWVSACYVYCREAAIMDRCLELMGPHDAEWYDVRQWHEEHAMTMAIDELMGGWQGVEHYARCRHQPPGIVCLGGHPFNAHAEEKFFAH